MSEIFLKKLRYGSEADKTLADNNKPPIFLKRTISRLKKKQDRSVSIPRPLESQTRW